MQSERSSDDKRSNDYSTAAPYIIPTQIMDKSKNLRTMIYKDKQIEESRVSLIQNYFVRTRYDNGSDTETRYELRQSLKPKIPNKLNLQLPTREKVTIKRYVGEQREIEQKVTGLFGRLFRCCVQPRVQNEFEQCDYCQHRVYKQQRRDEQQQQQRNRRQVQPYISYKRLAQREKQPIQVFYQQITNQQIQNNRYGDYSYQSNSRFSRSKRNY